MLKSFKIEFTNGIVINSEECKDGTRYLQIKDDEDIDITDWDDYELYTLISIMSSMTEKEVHMACAYSMGDDVDWMDAFKAVQDRRIIETGFEKWEDLAQSLITSYHQVLIDCVDIKKYAKTLQNSTQVVYAKNGKEYWGHYFKDEGTHMIYGFACTEIKGGK